MNNAMDAVMVARLIMDLISMYRDRGIEVDLDSLEEAIANEKARTERINKQLGI